VASLTRALVSGLVLLLIGNIANAQASAPAKYSFTISASQPWTDTGVDLAAGAALSINAEAKAGSDANCNPQGNSSTASDAATLALASAPAGALLAKLAEKSDPVQVGSSHELHADGVGHLFLGVNGKAAANCSFMVKLEISPSSSTAAGPDGKVTQASMKEKLSSAAQVWLKGQFGESQANAKAESSTLAGGSASASASSSSSASSIKLPALTLEADLRQHIDGLPRRVHDHAGNLGDMVNFVIIGNEDTVKAALQAADWHVADVDSKEAGLKAIVQTYEKKDYLEMPMSHLYLFDRMQDYGYEQAEAFSVVASRHHFRLWKAPFTSGSDTVWVGAATHDVGFEKDIRTGKLTHKIDPEVDGERENLATSLEKSGKAKSMTYYLPPDPVQEAKNASGGGYHSDGRLLVIALK
jgi:LssY C-terminus